MTEKLESQRGVEKDVDLAPLVAALGGGPGERTASDAPRRPARGSEQTGSAEAPRVESA